VTSKISPDSGVAGKFLSCHRCFCPVVRGESVRHQRNAGLVSISDR